MLVSARVGGGWGPGAWGLSTLGGARLGGNRKRRIPTLALLESRRTSGMGRAIRAETANSISR